MRTAYLHGASAPDDSHRPDLAFRQSLYSLLCDVRGLERIHWRQEHAHNIQRDIALPNDDRLLSSLQLRLQALELRQSVVPAHKLPR
jgi:hypothetical protein